MHKVRQCGCCDNTISPHFHIITDEESLDIVRKYHTQSWKVKNVKPGVRICCKHFEHVHPQRIKSPLNYLKKEFVSPKLLEDPNRKNNYREKLEIIESRKIEEEQNKEVRCQGCSERKY